MLGMVHGMVADGVTTLQDESNEFGMLPGLDSDEKEGGLGLMLIEEIEQNWGVHRIGAVIDGKPNLTILSGIGIESGDNRTTPGVARDQGGDEEKRVGK